MTLFRTTCGGCARPGPVLCGPCRARLEPPPTTRVRAIGAVPAVFAYAGTGARVVQALKYGDARRLVTVLADDVAELVHVHGMADVGTITWLPTSPARRHGRGFDQSELLARAVARRLDRRCRPLLTRVPGAAQTGHDRATRAVNVAFRPPRVAPRWLDDGVVVIEDVVTTGATLRAADAALGAVSPAPVNYVVLARTP